MIYVEIKNFAGVPKPATFDDRESIPKGANISFGPHEVPKALNWFALDSLQQYYGNKKDG